MTSFFRGVRAGRAWARKPPHPRSFRCAIATRCRRRQQVDTDQTFRYAEASGDPMPIHLDDEFAKSVGLPGIIIHGLCTMAFNSWAAIEPVCPGTPRG